jgi:hypothetical protein
MHLVYFIDFRDFQLGVLNQRACGTSAASAKTLPWVFEASICPILSTFVTFLVVCPISVPVALWRPQQSTSLELCVMYLMWFVHFPVPSTKPKHCDCETVPEAVALNITAIMRFAPTAGTE